MALIGGWYNAAEFEFRSIGLRFGASSLVTSLSLSLLKSCNVVTTTLRALLFAFMVIYGHLTSLRLAYGSSFFLCMSPLIFLLFGVLVDLFAPLSFFSKFTRIVSRDASGFCNVSLAVQFPGNLLSFGCWQRSVASFPVGGSGFVQLLEETLLRAL
jgi:hypothetical protein